MKTRMFSNDYVGIKLESVAEVMKYHALSNIFSICNEYEYYFDEYVEEGEGDNWAEREPTESEKLERILQAFSRGDELFATFWLDCGKVVPRAATTLQTDFHLMQKVYIMHDNKIKELVIVKIMLTTSAHKVADNTKLNSDPRYIKGNASVELAKEDAAYLLARESLWENGKGCSYSEFGIYSKSEVFATKDELVKHLMEG